MMFLYMLFYMTSLTLESFGNTIPKLELVQVLSRHGARTPLEVWDSDTNKDFWLKQGLGQLTNEGKQQHYELGQLLRTKFGSFLDGQFFIYKTLVNSTNKDRTLMSALSNLAGLYPPKDNQIWNKGLDWQPVPVHTKPKQIDYYLDTDSNCPRWSQLYADAQKSPGMKAIDAENGWLYKLATEKTGYNVTGIFTLNDVYDTLSIEAGHNMTLPDWVTKENFHQMDNLTNVVFGWKFHDKEMLRLRGGPILKQMLNYVNETITGHNKQAQLYMYFAHDFLLAAVLMELGVFDGIAPPFASSILLELYSLPAGGHAVQWSYRNSTSPNADYKVLKLPNCDAMCPLDKFTELVKEYLPEDIVKECQVKMDDVKSNLEKNW